MIVALLALIDPAQSGAGNNAILQIAGQFGIKPQLLMAQIVNFIIVACILTFFVVKPIQSKLDERSKLISDGLKRAEESEKTLAAAKAEKEAIIGEARATVQSLIERSQKEMQEFEGKKRQEAQKESVAMLEKARRDLAMDHEQQIARAQKELATLVITLAERSLEENLTHEQKNRFAEKTAEALKK